MFYHGAYDEEYYPGRSVEYPEARSDTLAKSLKNNSRRDRSSPISKMEKWLLRDHVLSDLVLNVESDKEVG